MESSNDNKDFEKQIFRRNIKMIISICGGSTVKSVLFSKIKIIVEKKKLNVLLIIL